MHAMVGAVEIDASRGSEAETLPQVRALLHM